MKSRIAPAPRVHIAERVFEQLVGAILQGEFPVDTALPSERVLGERCGASRVVVRQAIHRLADLGLVRVRQGSPTLVCDFADADLRVVELLYRFAPDGALWHGYLRDVVERDYLQGVMLLEVLCRRGSPAARAAVAEIAAHPTCDPGEPAQVAAFEQRFWHAVARAGGNRILLKEFDWWQRVLAGRAPAEPGEVAVPGAMLLEFYRELGRRIRVGEDAVGFYLDGIRPVLDHLFSSMPEEAT